VKKIKDVVASVKIKEQKPPVKTKKMTKPENKLAPNMVWKLSYGPPWAHCLGRYQDRLLGGLLGLLDLCPTVPTGVTRKEYGGEVLGEEAIHTMYCVEDS
jgi:hypothetical protein